MRNQLEFERVKAILTNYRKKYNLPEPTEAEIIKLIKLMEGLKK